MAHPVAHENEIGKASRRKREYRRGQRRPRRIQSSR